MIRGGGGRFAGYGNVNVSVGNDRPHRGWQLTCSNCGALSTIIHRTGQSYPPKVLFQMFHEMKWKVGSSSKNDVCPECQEKLRERRKQERKWYVNGTIDRLLDAIRNLDRLIASSVTVDYGDRVPEIEAQLRSLFETAYLCNIFPKGLIGEFKEFFKEGDKEGDNIVTAQESTSAPEPPPQPESELVEKVLSGEMSMTKAREIYHAEEPAPPPPAPPPPVQAPAGPQEGHRMSPRTAEFLAETRRKITQLRSREHDDATH